LEQKIAGSNPRHGVHKLLRNNTLQ
jgi:hypothetical protein